MWRKKLRCPTNTHVFSCPNVSLLVQPVGTRLEPLIAGLQGREEKTIALGILLRCVGEDKTTLEFPSPYMLPNDLEIVEAKAK
jgi:hypothetical protein